MMPTAITATVVKRAMAPQGRPWLTLTGATRRPPALLAGRAPGRPPPALLDADPDRAPAPDFDGAGRPAFLAGADLRGLALVRVFAGASEAAGPSPGAGGASPATAGPSLETGGAVPS